VARRGSSGLPLPGKGCRRRPEERFCHPDTMPVAMPQGTVRVCSRNPTNSQDPGNVPYGESEKDLSAHSAFDYYNSEALARVRHLVQLPNYLSVGGNHTVGGQADVAQKLECLCPYSSGLSGLRSSSDTGLQALRSNRNSARLAWSNCFQEDNKHSFISLHPKCCCHEDPMCVAWWQGAGAIPP